MVFLLEQWGFNEKGTKWLLVALGVILTCQFILQLQDIHQENKRLATSLNEVEIRQELKEDEDLAKLSPWGDWPGLIRCLKLQKLSPHQQATWRQLCHQALQKCQTLNQTFLTMSAVFTPEQRKFLLAPQTSISAYHAIGAEGTSRYIAIYAVHSLQRRCSPKHQIPTLPLPSPSSDKMSDSVRAIPTLKMLTGIRELCDPSPYQLSCVQAAQLLELIKQLRRSQVELNRLAEEASLLLNANTRSRAAQWPLCRKQYLPSPVWLKEIQPLLQAEEY